MNVGAISGGMEAVGRQSAATGGEFGQAVIRQLSQVNELQSKAEGLTQAYAAGQDVDVHRVVLATQEAQIGLDLMLQVRNKVIDAYQELMRMPM
jgi:flagellar hook-basal body complex protein FliE